MSELEGILDRIGEEMSGYSLAYDPVFATPYVCRAWWGEHGPCFSGIGMTVIEAAQQCLEKVLEFKGGLE